MGISSVCLGSSRVMSAVKTRNIKGLRRDPCGTLVVVQAQSLVQELTKFVYVSEKAGKD